MIRMTDAQTHLWGTASNGGTADTGTIFVANIDGSNLHKVHSFAAPFGANPEGAMVLANNGKFYGVTFYGGTCGGHGVAYTYNPISGIYNDIYNFFCTTQNGWLVYSGPMLAVDGEIYGLTTLGGSNGFGGVIYRIDPATNIYSVVYKFVDTVGSSAGINPEGTLIQLSDGKLYGMTIQGGEYDVGVIFSFNPSDSAYTELHSFDKAAGARPSYGSLLKATDGKLYGMTGGGGPDSVGVIFSYDVSTNVYTDVHNFDTTHGAFPDGSLIQATNGLLYGMTSHGGANNAGVIFSFDISTNTFTDLFNFDTLHGINPTRSLMQASNGLLFGTTYFGGINGDGVFFSFNTTTNTYTVLYNFDGGLNGGNPLSDIVEEPDSLTMSGIETITYNKGIGIYPNPTSGAFTLSYNSQLSILNSQFKIYDVTGREVYSQPSRLNRDNQESTIINVSNLSNGIYYWEMKSNNGIEGKGKLAVIK